jgi:ATP-dependent Lon protease
MLFCYYLMTEWLKNNMKKSNFLSLDSLSLQDFDENSELIPLMTPEDEELINNESLPESLPILPLRNTVLFPGVVIPITAGRDTSIKLINDANKGRKSYWCRCTKR